MVDIVNLNNCEFPCNFFLIEKEDIVSNLGLDFIPLTE